MQKINNNIYRKCLRISHKCKSNSSNKYKKYLPNQIKKMIISKVYNHHPNKISDNVNHKSNNFNHK